MPNARPANRYSGMVEKSHRFASRARNAQPTIKAPSSRKILEASGMDGSITDLYYASGRRCSWRMSPAKAWH